MSGEERARRVSELFESALELEGAERKRLLEEAEPALREEVEELLAYHAQAHTGSLVPAGAAPPERKARLPRGTRLGRYVVLHELGAGGMSVVYAAYDVELERKVALKLLLSTPGLGQQAARARLVREAQAMARVRHPHVVSVYEVVAEGELVSVAMELMEGGTLSAWLKERPRPWPQVLARFVAAGQGLAAAHAAGLVHRDFKPSNVLLGERGRVCVTDFGLAYREQGGGPGEEPAAERVVGTPRYMAPEQLQGRAPDARSDQFSFCVALYSALCGQPPWEPGEPPRRARVPWWVRRAVLRGLSLRPEERFSSMEELLAALSEPPRAWRTARAAAAVGLGVGALALGGLGLARWQSSLCSGAPQQLAGAWDEQVRYKLQSAFSASDKPYAATTWATVNTALGAYAQGWTAMYREACEATRLRGEQSEQVMTLRMACLERRRKALRRVTRVLAEPQGQQVGRALELVEGLPELQDCADAEALLARLAPPSAPEQRAEYERIEAQLEHSREEQVAGRYPAARALARQAVEAARALGHPGLLAEALFEQANMQHWTGELEAATRSYVEAWRSAEVARDDTLRARVGSALTYSVGYRQGRLEEGLRWAELTESVLERLGGSEHEQARLLLHLGAVLGGAGRKRESTQVLERALALTESSPEAHAHYRWQVLINLAINCWRQDSARAIALMQEAQALLESRYGPGHSHLGHVWLNLSEFLSRAGRHAEALEYAHKALALLESTHGPAHFMVGYACHSTAAVLEGMGRLDEALAYSRRALSALEGSLGPGHQDVALPLSQLGLIHLRLGHPERALPLLERALSLHNQQEQVRGQVRFTLARTLEALGREPRRSLALATEAREAFLAEGLRQELHAVEAWLAGRAP